MSYLETEAGQREVARHLAAVRAERGVTRDIGEATLLEAGFAANLHPRDRKGQWREVLGELGPRGQTKIGGTAHRGLPKPSKAPKVAVKRGKAQVPSWQGREIEMEGHEVLPGVALVQNGSAGYRAYHTATGLPIHQHNLKGSHKAAVETTRGALGHVDWTAPDTKSFQGSESHRRAQRVMDHAAQRSQVNHYGYRESPEYAEDREGMADLRARGAALEGGAEKPESMPRISKREANAEVRGMVADQRARERHENVDWKEAARLYKIVAGRVKTNGADRRRAISRLRQMGIATGGPGADWMDEVAVELKKMGLLDHVIPKRVQEAVALAHDVSYTEDMIGESVWRANLHPRDRTGKFRDLFTPGKTRVQAHDVVYARGHLDPSGSGMNVPLPGSFTIQHATNGKSPTYRITHRTDDDEGSTTGGFGVSETTGQWVAWRQVGPKIPGRAMIPVDVAHAKDVGDAEGTLEFDWANAVRLHAHESMGHNSDPESWKHVHGSTRPMPKGKPVPRPQGEGAQRVRADAARERVRREREMKLADAMKHGRHTRG